MSYGYEQAEQEEEASGDLHRGLGVFVGDYWQYHLVFNKK